jgi:TldD protein
MMISLDLIKKVLNILTGNGGDFSEIFIQKRRLNNLRMDDSKIEKSNTGFELGCGLRLINKDSTYYAYVDSIEKEKIINAAKVLSSAVNESEKLKILDLTDRKSKYSVSIKDYPSKVSQEIKKGFLIDADTAARNIDSSVMQVTANISDLEEEILVANSDGFFSEDSKVKVFISINTVAKRGSEIRTGYRSMARTGGYEIFTDKRIAKSAIEAAKSSVLMLDAQNAPTGKLPVVLGPAFGGVIFHEACGHGLEADAIIKDASVYKGKIGKKIANKIVSAVDDSTIPYHWGSYSFDGEGFPSQKNTLIEDGILIDYIYDYRTAKKLKSKQTGNGRRQSYRDIPLPRMSNTYIRKGRGKHEDIIKSVSKGIFAKEFAGGQVNPATGDFVFGISEGYIIEKGSIAAPVKGATLIGNGPEILNKIESVADNIDFAPGFCGKAGQSVSNEVGQPTILVSEMTVGGTNN